MSSVLLVLQLIVAIFLVAVILMQRSNGGALSGLGGGDGIGGLLSARSKGNILTRITAILATLFFGLSIAISIYFSRMEVVQTSVIDSVTNNTAPAAETQAPTATEAADVSENEAETPAPVAENPAEEAATEEKAAEPEVPVAE